MKKAILKDINEIIIIDSPEPELEEGEALIEVKACGICHSDVAPYKGENLNSFTLPVVLGHEFGGIIREIRGERKGLKIGDKVTVSPQISCKKCFYCKEGNDQLCDGLKKKTGENLNIGTKAREGAFAERIKVPISNIVKLPNDFDMQISALIEPAAVAYNNTKNIKNSNIVIVGVGAIGLMAIKMLKLNNNHNLLAVDINDRQLKKALEIGANGAINIKDNNRVKKVKDFLKKGKVDYVLLYYTSDDTINFAIDIIRKLGEIKIIGWCPDEFIKINFSKLLMNSIKLEGCWCYSMDDFKKTIKLITSGQLLLEDLISKKFHLNEIKEGFEFKKNNFVAKVIITN